VGIQAAGETKMTDSRLRCLTVLTIALGIAMLAPNRAISQLAAEKKAQIKAANEKKKQADAAAKKAKATKEKIRDWHVGDELPADDFDGGFTLQKNFNPDRPARAVKDNDQPAAEGTPEYLTQQVLEVKRGQRPGGYSKPAVEQRQRAVDNLKALGPAAIGAVPALAWSASLERDAYVRRGAIEILGDIGGMFGVWAVSGTLLQPEGDPETVTAAENALLKLLPAVGGRLTMNDAILLLQLHDSGNERVLPAIETAWAARGYTEAAVAKEVNRRALVAKAIATAKANEIAEATRQSIEKWRQEREAHDQAVLNALRAESGRQPQRDNGPTLGDLNREDARRRAQWEQDRARINQNR
jgi:hypothetical protein